MDTKIIVGDVLACSADVLISTANPWLNMSGGVNGAILAQCGDEIQAELREHQRLTGKPAIPAGSVVRTSAGSLDFQHIIHAVAIDPFYDSSVEIIQATLTAAIDLAIELKAKTIATPMLATGYGRMTTKQFATAFAPLLDDPRYRFNTVTIVVRRAEDADVLNSALAIRS